MVGLPTIADIITRAIVLLVAFPAHEGAHAFVADRLGDPTPRQMGRMTLNPLRHLDVVGSLLFLYAGIGWATTPVNPYYLGRRGMALVSVAGPLANLAVALLFALPAQYVLANSPLRTMFGVGNLFPSLGQIVLQMLVLNLLLFVFNLIPVPPLDGFSIVKNLAPYNVARSLEPVERYGLLIMLLLVVSGILSRLIMPPLSFLVQLFLRI